MARTQLRSWRRLQAAYYLAVLLAAAWLGAAALQSDAFTPTQTGVATLTAIVILACVPRLPGLGLCLFILAAYGLPRYGAQNLALLQLGLLDWLAGLVLLGSIVWIGQSRVGLQVKDWLLRTMTLFVIWSLVCLLVAWSRGSDTSFVPTHHPAQFAQAWVLMLVAVHVFGQRTTDLAFGFFLCCIPVLRALLQGVSGIYLDGDIAALCVITLPIALLAAFSVQPWPMRAAFALLAALIVAIFWAAQNRGAMLGLVFALVALAWNSRLRLFWAVAAVPAGLAMAFVVPSTYVDRFRVFIDPLAHHATAGLDRSTADGRVQLWRAAWQTFVDHYGWGVGPGNSAAAIQTYLPTSDGVPIHNNLLDVAAETGVVGLLLYVGLFLGAIILLQSRIRRAQDDWPRPGLRMVQAALAAYLGIGLVLSRHDMQLAYLLVGWGAALLHRSGDAGAAKLP